MLPAAVGIAFLATMAAAGERGAAPVIAVVSPPQGDRAMMEALNRFRGEAAAVGFGVIIVPASRGAPSAQMESVARAVPGVATVAFVRGSDPTELDVWFTDRLDGQTIVDHVSVESNRADRAVVLAVKGVDVLRARMFGLLARRGRPPGTGRADAAVAPVQPLAEAAPTGRENVPMRDTVPPREPQSPPPSGQATTPRPPQPTGTDVPRPSREIPPPDATPTPTPQAEGGGVPSVSVAAQDVRDTPRWGIATGVTAMRSVPGLGTAFLFVLRAEYDLTSRSAVRMTVGGLGTRPEVSSSAGRALVRDTLLMLEWAASPWGHRVRPVLAAGGGVHYFSAEGMAADTFRARTVGQWVGMLGVSVGARAALGRHLALGVDAGAQILLPQVEVALAGENRQRGGRPATMATLTLQGRL